MNLLVCLDDRDGMAFNRRRQSADNVVIQRILEISQGKLYLNSYSSKLFPDATGLHVCDDYWKQAGEDNWVFAETDDVSLFMSEIQNLVIFRWNRVYPRDLVFPLAKFSTDLRLMRAIEYSGDSHERITESWYCL